MPSPTSKAVDEKAKGTQVDAIRIDSGVDVAVSLVAGHAEDPQLSNEEFRKLRNKLDRRLLPLLFALYTRESTCGSRLL